MSRTIGFHARAASSAQTAPVAKHLLAMARITLLAAALALLARAAFAAPLALVGGTVHTVSGATIENATVVIDHGKITAVGAGLTPPADAQVISVQGKQVYPGFVSANSVLGLTEIESVRGTNDFAETGDVNPNVRSEVEVNPSSELIPVARVNGITSIVVIPQGGAISGTAALVHLQGWTTEDMTVKAPIGLEVNWPNMAPVHAWFITQSDDDQKKARDKAIDNIRKSFDDARAYWTARDAEGRPGVPRHDEDVKWDAMGKALKGEIPVMIRAENLSQIRAALKFADDEKLPRVILVGGSDSWRVADELKARHISVICDRLLDMPMRRSDSYDQNFSVPAELKAAGVPFCISDGGGAFGAMNSRNLPYNAAMAAAFGLSREDALKSVTLWPAQILGVADRVGSIETGKCADLMVTNGDPLEIATQIEQVYINGAPVSFETRQSRLFHQFDARPRGSKARSHGTQSTATKS
ncbi:MAG TPA: amidohydrolase family protein, partial [Candidatus Udaeobacter sp.]|nr:amidohydrolase family protein [Candidatus Udaeobacter sp.]